MEPETSIFSAIVAAFVGGMQGFFALVDWPFLMALIVAVFLSNLVLPATADLPRMLRWVGMHRYRVPTIAFGMAWVFLVFRDYADINRALVLTYFLTLIFSMCLNIWFLDKPADHFARKYPWLKLLLKGRDPEPAPCK